MAELKTKATGASVRKFLDAIPDDRLRADCWALVDIMRKATGDEPRMWGPSIVGFGSYHYKYDSGREGDWMQTGFSPRKQNLTLYLMSGVGDHGDLLERLGPHSTGKSCLYVKRLSDLHLPTLKTLVAASVKRVRARRAS